MLSVKQVARMNLPPRYPDKICRYECPETGPKIPLLIDFPHSGTEYPDDFQPDCPKNSLELCEELYLDSLFSSPVVVAGGTTLKAGFPRTYVDVNRSAQDIDALLLATPWDGNACPNGRSIYGHGVVMRLLSDGVSIYNRKLNHHDIQSRIDNYYTPYHTCLGHFMTQLHNEFKIVHN